MIDWTRLTGSALAAELQQRHGEPQRAYHDWSHIAALLAYFAELEESLHDRTSVLLAILFHDAVYDPRATNNEEASAMLLETSMAGRCDDVTLARATGLVRATSCHQLPGSGTADEIGDAAHFLDMDLAILGAGPAHFDRYEAQIRQEYAHVPVEAFTAGRAAILEGFLARPWLYFSEWGRGRFEVRARENLTRSIARLRGG